MTTDATKWKIADFVMAVIALLVTVLLAAGGLLTHQVWRNGELLAGISESVVRNAAKIKSMEANRFTDVHGERLKNEMGVERNKILAETAKLWQEIGEIKTSIAKLPPQEWRDRIRGLEEYRWKSEAEHAE